MENNVIYVLCDQLRAQALSCYGNENISTPNIDLLALEGVMFTNSVATTPLCTPARGNILTGSYVHEHSAHGHDFHLNHDRKFVSDCFNDNDYLTMYFGKWHLDGCHVPIKNEASTAIIDKDSRGNFDIWIGYENNNSQNHYYLHGHDLEGEIKSYRPTYYETDYIMDLAISKIEENKNKKFFSFINFQPPHDPYIAPAKYMEQINKSNLSFRDNVPKNEEYLEVVRNDLSGYYAMIKNIDDNIGKLIKYLRDNDLYKNTHIVFSSDHGDMHGSHGQFRKTTFWEESIKVPFIIGGTVPFNYEQMSSNDTNDFIGQYDVAPTLLGLANIEKANTMVGIDYSYKRYSGKTGETRDCITFGNLVPTGHHDSHNCEFRGIITKDNIKYVVDKNGSVCLFNLNNDPYEQANLLYNPKYDELQNEMHKKLVKQLELEKDPFLKEV